MPCLGSTGLIIIHHRLVEGLVLHGQILCSLCLFLGLPHILNNSVNNRQPLVLGQCGKHLYTVLQYVSVIVEHQGAQACRSCSKAGITGKVLIQESHRRIVVGRRAKIIGLLIIYIGQGKRGESFLVLVLNTGGDRKPVVFNGQVPVSFLEGNVPEGKIYLVLILFILTVAKHLIQQFLQILAIITPQFIHPCHTYPGIKSHLIGRVVSGNLLVSLLGQGLFAHLFI